MRAARIVRYLLAVSTVVVTTAIASGACSRSPEWERFFKACRAETESAGEFFYRDKGRDKPLDWKESPYKSDLIKMCHAKANLFVEGFQLSPPITVPEYRLYLGAELTDRDFERELRRSLRRD